MMAAEKGEVEVCVKLAELGARLNKANWVIITCSYRTIFLSFMIVMLTLLFELGWQDGLGVGCREGSVGSLCEAG